MDQIIAFHPVTKGKRIVCRLLYHWRWYLADLVTNWRTRPRLLNSQAPTKLGGIKPENLLPKPL
jgi:hypothetical protein